MRSHFFSLAFVAALASLGTSNSATAQGAAPAPATTPVVSKIAVLDTQKVLRESEEGLRVESNLRKLFDAKKGELVQKEKQLGQEYEELAKEEKSKGKSEALERKKLEFKQKYAAFQQATVDLQSDLGRKQNELYGPMIQKIGNIVRAMVAKESYDLVLEKQAAVYFRADLEITEKVIQAYNAGEGTKTDKKAPPPKPVAPRP